MPIILNAENTLANGDSMVRQWFIIIADLDGIGQMIRSCLLDHGWGGELMAGATSSESASAA